MLPMNNELLVSRKRQRVEEVQVVSFSSCPPTHSYVKECCGPTQPFVPENRRGERVIAKSSKDPTDSDVVCFGMVQPH